jgi:hypothetical protein
MGRTIMAMSTMKVTYYNGYLWHMIVLPSGTRAVWPSRRDGGPVPGAATRYYPRPARVIHGERRQRELALARQ